ARRPRAWLSTSILASVGSQPSGARSLGEPPNRTPTRRNGLEGRAARHRVFPGRRGLRASGSWAPQRLLVRAVDVVPAVLECRALSSAAATLLTEPTARALRGEHLWRAVSQAQIPDGDLMPRKHKGDCTPEATN